MEHHYPDFDVMAQKEHWDKHTQQIVERRLEAPMYQSLSGDEITTLSSLCSTLIGDNRKAVLDYVMSHFDNKLISDIGEGQRQKELPKFGQLVRLGLKALDGYAKSTHSARFHQLTEQQQSELIQQLIDQDPKLDVDGVRMKAKDFLSMIHTEAVAAYYSHPTVWSEMGYAGPAYPRGYVRTERGLTDPWEAKRRA
ncbi:gluconate 2-dehydrogenase subunit 3 family protein [Alicyclobacillus tolerans]|uniref:gluconate 2-dehydrogenase subunit 3 family protein n=1 Tax=Alicyclobacillus tolerans TaxID=90970 RepID=UPI001F40C6CD|nr:gluconate 2-dehydrogenase subunit 3 family protein [Alicyclobacillus tolerans]MCF8567388.1 gluconate 2-dehydrogenase subunit 3 family protein [Alicyclobacillus tolerans]